MRKIEVLTRVCVTVALIVLVSPPAAFSGRPKRSLDNEIKQDSGARFVESKAFIVPNEFDTFLLGPIIRSADKGAHLVIGSMRGFSHVALQNEKKITRLILVDLDPRVTAFNIAEDKLLSAIGSQGDLSDDIKRYQYLSVLFGRWATSAALRPIVDTHLDESTKIKHILNGLRSSSSQYSAISEAHINNKRLASAVSNFVVALGNCSSEENQEARTHKCFESMGVAITKLVSRRDRLESTIIGSNQAWSYAQDLIKNGQVMHLTGDIAGEVTLKSLATALKSLHEQVSVVDVSNVPDYIARGLPSLLESGSSQKLAQIYSNLENLPLTKDPLLILTTTGRIPNRTKKKNDDVWTYVATSLNDFLNTQVDRKLVVLKDMATFNSYLAHLTLENRLTDLSNHLIVSGHVFGKSELAALEEVCASHWRTEDQTNELDK